MNPEIENQPRDMEAVNEEKHQPGDTGVLDPDVQAASPIPYRDDAFGDEHDAEIKYKVLKWWYAPSRHACLTTLTLAQT